MARRPRSNSKETQRTEEGSTRKRTLAISLLAVGAGAVTFVSFYPDDEKSANKMFTSQAQCERDSAVPAQECAVQYKAALAAHEKNAPKYPVKVACELEYGDGNCVAPASQDTQTAQTSRSYYMPLMTGYLLGRNSSGRYQAAPLYRKRNDPPGQFRQMAPFPQPAARSTGGTARTSRSAFRSRTWTSRSGATRVSTRSSRTSRGGFGRSSRGYSGG